MGLEGNSGRVEWVECRMGRRRRRSTVILSCFTFSL
uniref:Uncharacterized protein n=1 Tax=Anguilla anguilla TaxID=7936 RepID=A0A0E9SPC4_ANGAN